MSLKLLTHLGFMSKRQPLLPMRWFRDRKNTQFVKWMLVGLLSVSAIVPMRLAIAEYQAPSPQAIFVLGGNFDRMVFAGKFWQSHPNLDVWVSDFPYYESKNRELLHQFNVPDDRIKFDGRPTDTVTNFTTLVKEFANRRLQHLYLITSDYHMRRARAIALFVLGSRGIVTTPIPVPSQQPDEPTLKVVRDSLRSFLWIVTKHTGASLNPNLRNYGVQQVSQ